MKKIALFYFVFFIVFSFLFFFLFHTPLFAGQKVLFYRGLGLLGVTVVIMGGLVLLRQGYGGQRKWGIKSETYVAALVLSFSFHLAFFVVFPVTFDRSVTMFLLDTLNKKNCISPNNLESIFIEQYVKGKAIPRRIFEQKQIGFIEEKRNCVDVTQKTKTFLQLSQIIKTVYGLK